MNIEIVSGNILDNKYTIFCHQVNCLGVMGAGLALQIKNKYPEVYQEYREYLKQHRIALGTVQLVQTHDNRVCVNIFAQFNYGHHKVYTRYDMFQSCLDKLVELCRELPITDIIAFPQGIGCGMAGGDWGTIYRKLEDFSRKVQQKVYIVKYEKDISSHA